MTNFENQEYKYSRKEIIERIQEFSPEDPLVKNMVENWVVHRLAQEGLTDISRSVIFSLIQEAALYFDAGYKKECLVELKKAEIYSKTKDKPPYVKEEAVITVDMHGDIKKKEELYDYFLTTSRDLERALQNN